MQAAYVSALAALAGSVVGGFTSFATSWLVQQNQSKNSRKSQELAKREQVYGAFIDEVSKRYGEALEREQASASDVVTLYSQISRMLLFAPRDVVSEARSVIEELIDAYVAVPRSFAQMHAEKQQTDPLREFSELCRKDLESF